MKHWLKRVRGALGMGLTWGVAWSAAGAMTVLGILLMTGQRPDPPFPLMFGFFGMIAGIVFSAVLGLAESHRPIDQMSFPRFAAWGAAVGLLLSAIFFLTVALAGDLSFLWNFLLVGPLFAAAAAGSAAGSLALARRTQRWRRLFLQLSADRPSGT